MMRCVIYGDIRIFHSINVHYVSYFMVQIKSAGKLFKIPIPGHANNYEMPHVAPAVLYKSLFPSKHLVTILVDRYNNFTCESV